MHLASEHSPSPAQAARSHLRVLPLPFVIRIVRTEEHLRKAVDVRAETYKKHHPELADSLTSPEKADREPFSLVLLAESKLDGQPVGTMRIETNVSTPLAIEDLLPSNSEFKTRTLAFVTRSGVRKCDDSQLIKIALFKALHRYCLACQIDSMIVTAKPPMDKQYVKLGFMDVFDSKTLIPIPWSGDIRTRVLYLNAFDAEKQWRDANHPLYDFMIRDFCPDIQIFSSVSGIWGRARQSPSSPPSKKALDEVFGEFSV